MKHPHAPKLSSRLAWLPGLVNLSVVALRFLERSAGPVIELLIRLVLAQVFFVSGILKAGNWTNALYLAANEYPVAWLGPVAAAWLGVLIELVGSVLLATGLATRFAALALAALALVIQFSYQTLDTHLFWVALLVWFVVRGAGALSLDRLRGPAALRMLAAARIASPHYYLAAALEEESFGGRCSTPQPFASPTMKSFSVLPKKKGKFTSSQMSAVVQLVLQDPPQDQGRHKADTTGQAR